MADSADTGLHITGFPVGITEEQVAGIFAALLQPFGGPEAVKSVKVLPAREDKPDAAVILNTATEEQATWLIENVNEKLLQGFTQPLMVKKKMTGNWGKGSGKGWGFPPNVPQWAIRQFMEYKGGKGWGKGRGLSSFPAEKKVWIGGLPEEGVTYQDLQAHFPGSKFAAVMKGKGAGTGGVAFATAEEATAAIQTLNGSSLAGATLVVDVWTTKTQEAAAAGEPAAA